MIVFLLFAASALIGLAIGFFFRVWAMVPASLVVSALAATAAWSQGFQILSGVLTTFGCVTFCQIAYVSAAATMTMLGSRKLRSSDEVDSSSGGGRDDRTARPVRLNDNERSRGCGH
jgi:predicted membrane protein